MKRGIRLLFALGTSAMLLLSGTSTLAHPAEQGGAGAKSELTAERRISEARQRAAMRFWTRERIAQATALAMPAQAEAVAPAAHANGRTAGPAGVAPAGAPAPNADAIASAAYPQDWAAMNNPSAESDAMLAATSDEMLAAVAAEMAAGGGGERPNGTSQIYTSYIANSAPSQQTLFPLRWIGRLVFSVPGSANPNYCSATAISGNVIVTAAHCLYDSTGNRWYSNWVFAPAYRNGSAPFGTFAASTCWVLNSYINLSGNYSVNGWARHDVGVCKMGTNTAGQTLNQAVGWAGRTWNFPAVRHYHNLGYPLRDYNWNVIPHAGLFLRACVGESFYQAVEVRGMGCNWGGGISGGPWMLNYHPNTVTGYVDAVNSGLFIGGQNIFAGRFNSDNIVVLCGAGAAAC